MAVYQIGDGQYELPDDISGDQLNAVVGHISGNGQAPSADASAPTPDTSNASIGDEAVKGLATGVLDASHPLVTAAGAIAHGIANGLGDQTVTDRVNRNLANVKAWYDKWTGENTAAVPHVSDVHDLHSAGLYVSNILGRSAPYLAAAAAGGVPGAAVLGGAEGADQAYQQTGSLPAAAAGGAIGAATAALPVPFARGAAGPISGAVRGAAGGAVAGAIQGATANVPQAIASGNPTDAMPSGEQIADATAGGAVAGGTLGAGFGAAHSIGAAGAPADPNVVASDAARARLAARIRDEAKSQDYKLTDVDSAGQTSRVLNNVHNSLAEEIKANAKTLADRLDPQQATSDADFDARVQAQATLRDARNKVKSTASPDDIANLHSLVGDTAEGHQLIDSVRQSNHLTDLTNGGLIGGVSRITDRASPLSLFTGGHGFAEKLAHGSGVGALGMGVLAHEPTIAATGLAVSAGGRAIDAVTGRRYPVKKFVNDHAGNAQPLDTGNAPSVLGNARAQSAADAANAQRIAERATELRSQRIKDNDPGLGGFDRMVYNETGLRPQQARMGVMSLAQSGMITPDEAAAWFHRPDQLMAGNVGNYIKDALDGLVRKGQLKRDPEWKPAPTEASARPDLLQSAYEAQARGNQDRVTAAQREITGAGLDPAAAQLINQTIARIGRTNNRSDARAIHRDLQAALPDSASRAVAAQGIEPLITQIRHATRDAADQAFRPQPLETTAVKRDSRGRPIQRERLNLDATDKIANTMAEAMPRGPLAGDVAKDGNPVSRLRAQLYKTRAGIDKPAYEGAREPNEPYLRQVADFHEKAIHDPSNPEVKASYDALARETVAQFKGLGKLSVETWKGQGEPYRNSTEMMKDVAKNGHLWFLPTDAAFGDGDSVAHPMLADTGLKTVDGHPLVVNDVFRIVHDFFGHTQHGFQFGPKGEYNAYREHAQMYSDKALPALAAETLAQNAWVNFGPHMRRLDGSIPQKGEPDFVPAPERKFSDQKAYAVPKELLDSDPNIARESVDDRLQRIADLYANRTADEQADGTGRMFQRLLSSTSLPEGADIGKPLNLRDAIPGFKGIAPFLSPDELARVTKRNASILVDQFKNLPSAEEMASVAYSGRAKRGWYQRSAKAITTIFGANDAPRFAALLAALSPQTSVEMNLTNAMHVWRGWIEADRPTDHASIMKVLGENVVGDKGPGSVLPAWQNNSIRALSASDGPITISGPKVNSFMLNLLGHVNEVTNDTWMANFANISQETFKGRPRAGEEDALGDVAGKTAGYMAMSALTRKAASVLTKRTGETWTPAEVQETVWSWAKALYEKANVNRSAEDIVKSGDLTHDDINSVPDFEKLFVDDTYRRILDEAGYGDDTDGLAHDVESRTANDGGDGAGSNPFSAEASGIGPDAFAKHLTSAARRLDQLRSTGRSSDEAADLAPGEMQLSTYPTAHEAYEAHARLGGIEKGYRVDALPNDEHALVKMPVKPTERPSAPMPPFHTATDPEGNQVYSRFIAGMEKPDGTLKGLSEPEVRTVAKAIARLIEDVHPDEISGAHGLYSKGNNTISVVKGLTPDEHSRVLGHETGHAIEAQAGIAEALRLMRIRAGSPDGAKHADNVKQIVNELHDISRLERPHLWSDDKTLESTFGRSASSIHEYRKRLDELLADAFRHYMANPASMKKTAPNAAKFMRGLVNPAKIGKVIAFTSLAGLTLPGIIQQAFRSGADDQDQ